jgi:hypothetical protein
LSRTPGLPRPSVQETPRSQSFPARLDAIQKANAKLIAAAPKMYDYIKLLASSGDLQAIHILESIDAGR